MLDALRMGHETKLEGRDTVLSRQRDEIAQLKDSIGATVVMVTHELPSIFAIANNSVYLDNNSRTMIAQGDPAQLREHSDQPVVRQFLSRSAAASTSAAASEESQ